MQYTSAVKAIYPFQTQQVRDLAWACFAAPLMLMEQVADSSAGIADCPLALTPARQLWLERLDRDANALLEHLAQRPSHRLGVYFEQLWHFFLQEDPDLILVAHNLPVHHEGRTLGEFDCIYFCQQRQRHVHLELAVKFFLGKRSDGRTDERNDKGTLRASNTDDWLGPDTRDRLDLKLDHLIQRQIQLGCQPVAQQQLAALRIGDADNDELVREIAFKGYLFCHPEHSPAPPAGFNPKLSLHAWITCTELSQYLRTHSSSTFSMLPKMQWLGTAHCEPSASNLDRIALEAQLQQHFAEDSYPLLVAALDANGVESQRFFVTGEHWPTKDTDQS